MKPTILFTGAGGAGTIYILRHLRQSGLFRTIAVDMNRYAAGLYIADQGYVVPAIHAADYWPRMREIVREENVQVAVPLIDEELIGFLDLAGSLPGLEVLSPRREFIAQTLDKWKCAQALGPEFAPSTHLLASSMPAGPESSEAAFPYILKPRFGRGSRGFAILRNAEELRLHLERLGKPVPGLIRQEYIQGTEYTISVVVDKTGRLLAVVPKEVIRKVGITQVGVTRENPQLEEVCRRINERLHPCGPFNVQLIVRHSDRRPFVIEINPRFSTTVALTIEAGVDEVTWLLLDRLGKPYTPHSAFRKNLLMTRYSGQLFLEEKVVSHE